MVITVKYKRKEIKISYDPNGGTGLEITEETRKYGDKEMCSLIYKELNDIPCVKDDYLIFDNLHKKFMNKKGEFENSLPK